LLWAFIPKMTGIAHIFGHFVLRLSLSINFDKKWVGLHFGRFVRKLIRLLCFLGTIFLKSEAFCRLLIFNREKINKGICPGDGGVVQWTSHPPQEQKTRVRIPPGSKAF
jgi:hypothetical protein